MEKIPHYFIQELNATVFTLEPDAVYTDMRDGIDEFYRGELSKYMLLDFSKLDKHLTSEEVMKIGQQMRRLGKSRKGGFDLIVVPGPFCNTAWGACMQRTSRTFHLTLCKPKYSARKKTPLDG